MRSTNRRSRHKKPGLSFALKPVARPAIMAVQLLLISVIDHGDGVPGRTGLDLRARNVQLNMAIRPVDLAHRIRRDQDMLSGPPVPCVDAKVADVPIGVIEDKILDMADLAIGSVDMIAHDLGDAAQ